MCWICHLVWWNQKQAVCCLHNLQSICVTVCAQYCLSICGALDDNTVHSELHLEVCNPWIVCYFAVEQELACHSGFLLALQAQAQAALSPDWGPWLT